MSEKLARQLFSEAQQFIAELGDTGWSNTQDASPIATNSSVDLFTSEERPLVVGLFGGTGVGKSSLLNRLAGAEIARTGVVRPTSMEITAYLHKDVQLDALPDHFAADRFSEHRHSNTQLSEVMWVDMPDFDSDETQNKDQVLQWLPHIDLLIYVVTPERYKDAEGWQMMIESGYRHAWLFVINQWDKADPVQYNEFTRMLESTGFVSPEVFRTVCNSQHPEDQFNDLVRVIESLAKRNVIQHLQERGWLQRLTTVQAKLKQESNNLAPVDALDLVTSFNKRWQDFEQASIAHLEAPFKSYSKLFDEDKTSAISTVLKSLTGTARDVGSSNKVAENIAAKSDVGDLWDDWQTIRMKDAIQQFTLAESEHGVPSAVLSLHSELNTADNNSLMVEHLKQSVESAIESPGNRWQRLIAKFASVSKIILPLLALGWVSWRVVNGFIAGAEDRTAYVGLDFLVNGLLLAGLGWLLPMLVEKFLVPSLPDAVYQGLHQGLQAGLDELEQKCKVGFDAISKERESFNAANTALNEKIDNLLAESVQLPDPQLSRVLMAKQTPMSNR